MEKKKKIKKTPDKCIKCQNPLAGGSTYLSGGETFSFCKLCDAIIKHKLTSEVIRRFMNDTLDLNQIQKDMIQARKDRNSGKSKWTNPESSAYYICEIGEDKFVP